MQRRSASTATRMLDQYGVAEIASERAEDLTGQFNDAFNITEYNEVPLTRRSVPFMDSLQKE